MSTNSKRAHFSLMLSAEEKELLLQAAKANGLPLGAYLRTTAIRRALNEIEPANK